jgi:hypothetical protein
VVGAGGDVDSLGTFSELETVVPAASPLVPGVTGTVALLSSGLESDAFGSPELLSVNMVGELGASMATCDSIGGADSTDVRSLVSILLLELSALHRTQKRPVLIGIQPEVTNSSTEAERTRDRRLWYDAVSQNCREWAVVVRGVRRGGYVVRSTGEKVPSWKTESRLARALAVWAVSP